MIRVNDRPLRVLHAFNRHRGGGGSDKAWDETIRLSREQGIEVSLFERDSRAISRGFAAKMATFASGLYAREAVRAFDRALAEERPDIVHTHELYPLISPWILPRATAAGVPVVHYCYDFRLTCPIATHARAGGVCTQCVDAGEHRALINDCRDNLAESAAYALRNALARRFRLFERHVAQFLVPSPFSRDWLIRYAGISPDRIVLNAPAVDLPATPADPAAGDYIAFAGRFVPEKGVEPLIEAARIAKVPLRLAGYVPDHPAIRPEDDIACVVTQSPEGLASFYRGARMLVVPSLWYETFSLVAAEAMAHGIPVIASDLGALTHTVLRDETGIMVPPGDVGALAAAIRRLWDDPELARKLGTAGRARVARDFSAGAHMEQLNEAYRAALRQGPSVMCAA